MSYFNHAFRKTFVGTATNPFINGNGDKLGVALIPAKGEFTFVNPKTWLGVNTATAPTDCCNLVLVSGSIFDKDKIGPFHGGYLETNKSKEINPRYVSRFYRVDPCTPQNNVVHVGSTGFTNGTGVATVDTITAGTATFVNGTYTDVLLSGSAGPVYATVTVAGNAVTVVTITGAGYGYAVNDVLTISQAAVATAGSITISGAGTATTVDVATLVAADATCCKEFLCGETYNLRLDVKGSPALRFLNHNAYLTLTAYTGCCADDAIAPTPVDSTLVMIEWANQIVNSPLISPFILPIVFDETGAAWYAPGTVDSLGNVVANTWDTYVSPGHTDGACAGLVLNGAYVDTKFGDCSFQVSDFYEKEPVRIYASEVDLNGDPCAFSTLCVVTECQGRQANGLGETVLRDLILSESYRQSFFATDVRIREITQGNAFYDIIDRNTLYTRYFIQHNVPRFNNPSSTFDNDQYLLEVITEGVVTGFETFVSKWLETCGGCDKFEVFGCETDCEPVTPVVPIGVAP